MDQFREYWPQITSGIAAIFWFAKLESSVKATRLEAERLQRQRDEDQAAHRHSRDETNAMLTEVRSDIKELLRRQA